MEKPRRIECFEDLLAWQKGMNLCQEIYRLTSCGNFQRDRSLRDQMRKAAVSIPSNIAEGFGRYRPADFRRFLTIANGSAFEVRSQTHLAVRLGYLDLMEGRKILQNCEEVSRIVGGLRKSIKDRAEC